MSDQPKVVACIDGSGAAVTVCDYAAWASQRLQAPLELLHVLDHSQSPAHSDLSGNIGLGSREHLLVELAELDEKRGRLLREQGKSLLEAAARRVRTDGVESPLTRQRHGELVDTLRELEGEIRLLVMGRQGEVSDSLARHVGSHLENVIRTLHRPILVTTGEFSLPRSLMLAFDNSPSTRKGLELLAESPLFAGLSIHLLMVGSDNEDARNALNAAQQHLQQAGLQVTTALRDGEVESVLLAYQRDENIDLIVMGAYGHSRIRQFLVGSTTTGMLRNTQCPLLLLR
ncbi:MAG TPA: universal stress protein [Pseudomonas sabulinigri]|uniref:UspA domain-containing protein n=1 Tax=marine sediment metagenome TaxID=412755 RepID=A0A0F9VGK1_9ZZZZ|nr:universal stress protein [Halopseudomonas sabulinigri]HEC53040.1 universal stress protein [Halopseudomonas sabulinigri]